MPDEIAKLAGEIKVASPQQEQTAPALRSGIVKTAGTSTCVVTIDGTDYTLVVMHHWIVNKNPTVAGAATMNPTAGQKVGCLLSGDGTGYCLGYTI